jgi:hypothetical protein
LSRLLSAHGELTYHAALLAALFLATVFILGQWQRTLLNFISELLSPIIAVIATVSAIAAVTSIGVKRNRLSMVWFSLMLGLVVWFLSEIAWTIYPVIFQISTPTPSIADVFGLVGYVPILLGLGLQAWPFRENFRTKTMVSAIAITLGIGLLALIVLMQAIASGPQGMLAVIVGYAYPILDFATLAVAVPTLLLFWKGTFWRPFLFLVLGILFALSAHMISAWATSNGSYYPGHPLELLFDWGYLSAALGFYLMRKKIRGMSI